MDESKEEAEDTNVSDPSSKEEGGQAEQGSQGEEVQASCKGQDSSSEKSKNTQLESMESPDKSNIGPEMEVEKASHLDGSPTTNAPETITESTRAIQTETKSQAEPDQKTSEPSPSDCKGPSCDVEMTKNSDPSDSSPHLNSEQVLPPPSNAQTVKPAVKHAHQLLEGKVRDDNTSEATVMTNGTYEEVKNENESCPPVKADPYSFDEDWSASEKTNFQSSLLKSENGDNHPMEPSNKKIRLKSQDSSDFTEDDEFDEYDEDEFDFDDTDSQDRKDRLVIAEDGKKVLDEDHKQPEVKKRRKRQNRFNGMSDEEVAKRGLPDLIAKDLDILIIGINPGMYAAFKGHHYAGPGNHFWKCMFLSGIIPHPMSADDDYKLLEKGIGFTNIVARTTKSSVNLTRQEIEEGTTILLEKIRTFKPRIACFNGKGIYEVFSGKKEFHFGKQPNVIEGTNTHVWVMPNSSARCAQLPRAVDKAPFYEALKKFRDYLTGVTDTLDESEVVFSNLKLRNFNEGSPQKKLERAMMNNADFKPGLLDNNGGFLHPDSGDIDLRIDPVTGKKRRGRPPKPRPDGTIPPPKRRMVDEDGNPIPRGSNPIDPLTGKKKRGRPKKCDLPPGTPPAPYRKKAKKDKPPLVDASNDNSSSSSLLDGMNNVTSMNSKPTKIVPPLPPFSPNFGMKDVDEKPVDLKSHKPYSDDTVHGNNRLQHPCDFTTGRPPQAEEFSSGSGYPHYPQQQSSQQLKSSENQSNFSSSPPNNTYPPANNYPGNTAAGSAGNSAKNSDDVSTKSITGLESLVDQIPALAENDSGVFSGSGAGSHPNTPRSVGPYSPAPTGHFQSSFHPPPPSHSGTNAFGSSPFAPSTSESLENSTNNYPVSSTTSNCTDFSVNSLVHNSNAAASAAAAAAAAAAVSASSLEISQASDPFSVSSLASAEATVAAASKYPGFASSSSPYGMFGSPPGSSFGAGGFLSGPNSFPAGHPMGPIGPMGAMAASMPYYGQYPNGPYGSTAPGFGATPYSHGLPMPNPSYPYPSPYGQSPYTQSPYF